MRNSYKEILVLTRFILLLGKNVYKRLYLPKQRERPWKNGKKWVQWAKQQLCMSVSVSFFFWFCFGFFFSPLSTTTRICQILSSLDANFPTLTLPNKLKWSPKCFKWHEAIFSVTFSWRRRCQVVMSKRGSTQVYTGFRKLIRFFRKTILIKIKLSKLKSGQYPVWMTQNSRIGDLRN